MTNNSLITKIIEKKERVDKLPALSKKERVEFEDQEIREQVYHSAKIEGSSVNRKDIDKIK